MGEWPITCPECDSWSFVYRSDKSGNVRRYRCKDCGVVYIATIKGMKSGSVISEPKNMKRSELYWEKVIV